MKNKKKLIIIVVSLILALILIISTIYLINYLRVKHAKIEVTLNDDLKINFLEEKHVSDFILSINGTIIDDYIIDTTKIGSKEISFQFINDDNIKVPYSYEIEVIDVTPPVIWLNNSYTITVGNDIDIVSNVLCGDDEDSNPFCFIEGEYDYNTPGKYPLTFKAIDRSGNENKVDFTLNVINPSNNNTSNDKNITTTNFSDIITNYKNDNTKIGIDVSGWQGDIDFEAIKNAGVEFIIIKVGGTKGTDGDYYVDSKFIQNITKANELGIDVGIYFYSYADSDKKAINEAKWVLEQIKDYNVTLPIAFDWEDWKYFNDYNLSFFGLTNLADNFLNTILDAGYQTMLYGSKNYLEKIWLPSKHNIWLAHYVDKTSYNGTYKFWQICDDGVIDGIDGSVDIDIMYIDE